MTFKFIPSRPSKPTWLEGAILLGVLIVVTAWLVPQFLGQFQILGTEPLGSVPSVVIWIPAVFVGLVVGPIIVISLWDWVAEHVHPSKKPLDNYYAGADRIPFFRDYFRMNQMQRFYLKDKFARFWESIEA